MPDTRGRGVDYSKLAAGGLQDSSEEEENEVTGISSPQTEADEQLGASSMVASSVVSDPNVSSDTELTNYDEQIRKS